MEAFMARPVSLEAAFSVSGVAFPLRAITSSQEIGTVKVSVCTESSA
jgi:hypothetical protein